MVGDNNNNDFYKYRDYCCRFGKVNRMSKRLLLWLLLMIWILGLSGENIPTQNHQKLQRNKINIALHAQVMPSRDKVVGSVITTDGLKAAFKNRFDVQHVDVFYPFAYEGFISHQWDLIVIEGWFLSIHEFIQFARSQSPHTIIYFYCLDPTYPGLSHIAQFHVDGYLTSSERMKKQLSIWGPTIIVPLAADPNVMTLSTESTFFRTRRIVYVGAGGGMLSQKPLLLTMLLAAVPFGLEIYGSSWDDPNIPVELRLCWRGVLPRSQLSSVYSSATVVLASTVESQTSWGMVNNRIFEALACGAIVISDFSQPVYELVHGTSAVNHSEFSSQAAIVEARGETSEDSSFKSAEDASNRGSRLEGCTMDGSCSISSHDHHVRRKQYCHDKASTMIGDINIVMFACSASDVSAYLNQILDISDQGLLSLKLKARGFIVRKHTWQHRAISILSFYRESRMRRIEMGASIQQIQRNHQNPLIVRENCDCAKTQDGELSELSSGVWSELQCSAFINKRYPHLDLLLNRLNMIPSDSHNVLNEMQRVDDISVTLPHKPKMLLIVSGQARASADVNSVIISSVSLLHSHFTIDHITDLFLCSRFQSFSSNAAYPQPQKTVSSIACFDSLSAKQGADDFYMWLAQYDILWLVAFPMEPVEIWMRTRIGGMRTHGSHRFQKKVLYLASLTRSSYLGDDLGADQKCSFPDLSSYDIVLFRSWLEYVIVENCNGGTNYDLEPSASGMRKMVMFDIATHLDFSAEANNSVKDDDQNLTTIICVWTDISLCSEAFLYQPPGFSANLWDRVAPIIDLSESGHEAMHNDSQDNNIPYRIILLGGTWAEWSSHAWLVNSATLSIIIHVATVSDVKNSVSLDAAIIALQSSSRIIYAHPGTQYKRDKMEQQGAFIVTSQDILWPLIVAIDNTIPIHLLRHNELLVSTTNYRPITQGGLAMQRLRTVHEVIVKLTAFASASSNFALTIPAAPSPPTLNRHHESAPILESLQTAPFAARLRIPFTFKDIEISVEGQFCVYASDKLVLCVLTPLSVLELRLCRGFGCDKFDKALNPSDSNEQGNEDGVVNGIIYDCDAEVKHNSPLIAKVNLSFRLRGFAFANDLRTQDKRFCVRQAAEDEIPVQYARSVPSSLSSFMSNSTLMQHCGAFLAKHVPPPPNARHLYPIFPVTIPLQ